MNLLIIGASGLIGEALYKEAKKRGHNAVGTYLNFGCDDLFKLDYGDVNQINKLISDFSCEVIVCPAGRLNVDWIEKNPQEAWRVNVEKLNLLFQVAASKKIPIAFYSTDYIFDGKKGPYFEEDIPNPLNTYGRHKLVAEIMLKTFFPKEHFIFRTTWVFGPEKQQKNFLYSVIRTLSSTKELRVSYDMSATPSYVLDVARSSLDVIERGVFGTFNLSSGKCISRFEFAKKIAEAFNFDSSLLIPVEYASMNYVAQRPLCAGLKNEKVTNLTRFHWTPLEEALNETRVAIETKNMILVGSKNSSLVVESSYNIKRIKEQDTKICIFIPCYNATTTLPKVFERIPAQIKEKVKEVFVVDNDSVDYTYLMAIGYREKNNDIKNLKIFKNAKNFGYGGSQKLAYAYAIKQGYDMVVMLHGDAQYTPEKLPIMIETMENDKSIDLLFGSRMTGNPTKGGMPLHRFLGNKLITFIQNLLLGTKISEFHSGYRIFRIDALKKIPFHLCSNDYHFDTEIIIQFINKKFKITEVTIDTYYGTEKSYVNIWRYGFKVLFATFCYFLYKIGLRKGLKKYELYNENLAADIDWIFNEFKTEIH